MTGARRGPDGRFLNPDGSSGGKRLGEVLRAQTGSHWQVRAGEGEARPSLKDVAEAKSADNDARIRELPVVKAALAAFPDARLVEDEHHQQRFQS